MYQFETKYLCNAATFVLIQGTAVVFKKYLVFLKLFSFIFNIDFASISFLLNAVMTFFFLLFLVTSTLLLSLVGKEMVQKHGIRTAGLPYSRFQFVVCNYQQL